MNGVIDNSYVPDRKANARNCNEIRRRDNSGSSSSFITSYGLEFCTLLFAIATSNYGIAVQNFYIDRICQVEKNLSWKECHNLTSAVYEKDEKSVEVIASEYQSFQNLIEYGFPILTSFFLGSWTDLVGSKPILVIAFTGYFFASLLYMGFSLLPKIPPQYILFSSVPIGLSGGLTALLISSISFITREVSLQERSFRLSILSVCIDGGATIGYFMGEKVYSLTGYTEVFSISVFLNGLAVICAAFIIIENKPETNLIRTGHPCLEFFNVAAVKDTVVTCFKRRQNNRRRCIIILMIALILQFLSWSVRSYCYLFTRNTFAWDFRDYSNFTIIISLLNNIGGLFMTLVAIKLFHISDIFLGLISTLSNLSGFLVVIFATSGWYMYLGYGMQLFGAITTAVIRSIMSKCVDAEEHGKLFSFVLSCELSMPFVAGPIYGLIYMNTAMTLPSAIFFVPVGINVLILIFYLYLYCSLESYETYIPLMEERN